MTAPQPTPTAASTQVSSELMKNYLAGQPIQASSPMEVVEDIAGEPILFWIGDGPSTDGTTAGPSTLYAVLRTPNNGAGTGWTRVAVSPPQGGSVTTFTTCQAPDGSVVVAAAVTAPDGSPRLYVTRPFDADPAAITGGSVTASWLERPGAPGTVVSLLLGDYRERMEGPLLVASVSTGGTTSPYFVLTREEVKEQIWLPYHVASTWAGVLGMALGRIKIKNVLHRGAYSLYQEADQNRTTHLQFTTLPNRYGQTTTLPLTVASNATCLAAVADPTDAEGQSILYAGGPSGIVMWPITGQASNAAGITVPVGSALGSTSLLARADAKRLVLWWVDAQSTLWMVNAAPGSSPAWTAPLSLRKNVAHVAAMRNQKVASNELFFTSTDVQPVVGYVYQDPASTLWSEIDLPLWASDITQEVNCYTTVVRFAQANQTAAAGIPVSVSASSRLKVVVNGAFYTLDPDVPITLTTDAQGALTVINQVTGITTPVLRFSAQGLAPISVNPAAKVLAGLLGIQSADDLKSITLPDGTPLVEGVDSETLEQAAAAIQQLAASAGQFPADGSSAAAAPDAPETADVASKQQLRVARPAPRRVVSFGVISDGVEAIESFCGDVLQAMVNGVEKVVGWALETAEEVAKGALKFLVQLGEELLSFVVTAISDALAVLDWICEELLGISLEKILQWLGFLFSWGDILDTRDAIVSLCNGTLGGLAASLRAAKVDINSWFNTLIAQISTAADSPAVKAYGSTNLADAGSQVPEPTRSDTLAAQASFFSSPGGSFASYQLAHGGVTQVPGLSATPVVDAVSTFLQTVVDAAEQIFSGVQAIVAGVVDLYKSGTLTLENLVKVVLSDTAITVLQVLKSIVDAAIEVMEDLVEVLLTDVLNRVIKIPVISGLYKLIAGGDNLSLLDGFALLLAIPATLFFKLLTGRAPFPGGKASATTTQFLATPAFGRTTMFTATEPSIGDNEKLQTYSQAGSVVSLISNIGIAIAAPTAILATEAGMSRLAAVESGCEATLYTLSWAMAMPFDDDPTQQAMDRLKWLFDAFCAIGSTLAALTSAGAIKIKAAKPVAEMMGYITSTFGLVDGVCGLIVGLVSYLLELGVVFNGDTPDYHGLASDSVKALGTLSMNVGTLCEALCNLSYQEELLIGTAVGYGAYAVMTGGRAAYALVEDVYYQAF